MFYYRICLIKLVMQSLPMLNAFNLELISTIPLNVAVGIALPYTGASLDVAQTTVNARYASSNLNLSVTLLFNRSDTTCDNSDINGPLLLTEYFNTRAYGHCAAVIVSGCGGFLMAPYLAKEWDVLLFTNGWVPPAVYNHIATPTSLGMAGSIEDSGSALLELLRFFKWFHTTILMEFSNGSSIYDQIYNAILSLLARYRKYDVLRIERVQYSTKDEQSQKIALQRASDRSRVLMILAPTVVVVRLLDKDIFRSVLYLTTFAPEGHAAGDVNTLLANRSMTLYGTKAEKGIQPLDLYPIRETYNSVSLFAALVNQSLNQDKNRTLTDVEICSGKRLKSLVVNRTFDFPSGSVFIDANGYRHIDLILMTFNNASGFHQRAARYNSLQQTYILDKNVTIEWVGPAVPLDVPACGFSGLEGRCSDQGSTSAVTAGVATVTGLAVVFLTFSIILIRRLKSHHQTLEKRPWFAVADDVEPMLDPTTGESRELFLRGETVLIENCGRWTFRGRDVWISNVKLSASTTDFTDQRIVTIFDMVHTCHQNNVNAFLGLITVPSTISVLLMEAFGDKGSLRDLLNEEPVSREFQKSFVQDLIQGLHFIHTSKLRKHGRLTSFCCIIDKHFVLKISKLGHEHLREIFGVDESQQEGPHKTWKNAMWAAPELVASKAYETDSHSDIYALGIILFETFTSLSLSETISLLSEKVPSPNFPSDLVPDSVLQWIVKCCDMEPVQRPTIDVVQEELFALLQIRKQDNLMSRTMRCLEIYASDLEDKVDERTQDLLEQRRLCDLLLEEMLPRVIVERLRANEDVTPKMFDMVTLFFSDIDGFGDFALANSPYDVIAFLNQVYSTLDVLIGKFDVYKVETINDSYVVASGLPIPNGTAHARAIAFMGLSFLKAYSESQFHGTTRLRVGIHSGPVAAGVVGIRAPRYCLFGDTMNTASRMESHGEPGRIHVSPTTADFLKTEIQLLLTPRGKITVKGKGEMETFWLESRQLTVGC
ncbi:Atrial natriuretic peptide receptor 2 [Hypsibius exemplaris]|uniref:guanylate cyclase n=1 Tax=Hypsibius exemplaris TaxID=2072580 RepID=A0A1W0WCE1_HYPEX|nr:Atrial natriuretic peptide receptor 2 [Hypsibius exemplaris]